MPRRHRRRRRTRQSLMQPTPGQTDSSQKRRPWSTGTSLNNCGCLIRSRPGCRLEGNSPGWAPLRNTFSPTQRLRAPYLASRSAISSGSRLDTAGTAGGHNARAPLSRVPRSAQRNPNQRDASNFVGSMLQNVVTPACAAAPYQLEGGAPRVCFESDACAQAPG